MTRDYGPMSCAKVGRFPSCRLRSGGAMHRGQCVEAVSADLRGSPSICCDPKSPRRRAVGHPSLLYTVLTCRAYYRTRLTAVQDTWAKQVENIVFLGDDMHYGGDRRILGFDVPPGYDHCGLKFYRYFLWLRNMGPKYAWYLICDDDTYIFRCRIDKALCGMNPEERVCWGRETIIRHAAYHQQLRGEYALPLNYPSGGAGFVLSGALVAALGQYLAHQEQRDPSARHTPFSRYGDVSIGLWMQKVGGRMLNDDRWIPSSPSRLKHGAESIANNLSYHYVSIPEFYQLAQHDESTVVTRPPEGPAARRI